MDIKSIKALGDETRWKILQLLSQNQYCVCALSNFIGISQSAISQHLKILREANLVIGEKRGYYTHYVIQKDEIKKAGIFLLDFSDTIRIEGTCPLSESNKC